MRSSIHQEITAGQALLALGALTLLACGAAPPVEGTSPPKEAATPAAAAPAPPPTATGEAPAVKPAEAPAASGIGVISGRLTGKPKQLQQAVVFVSDLADAPTNAKVTLDQKGQIFIPHVVPIVKGTTVEFANSDATGHNVFTPDGEKYDLGTFGLGEKRSYRFEREGVYTQLCKLHPSMLAYVVVVKNRWFTVAADDGSFRIEGVPAGERVVEAWQEKARGAPTKVTVVAGGEAKLELAMAKP